MATEIKSLRELRKELRRMDIEITHHEVVGSGHIRVTMRKGDRIETMVISFSPRSMQAIHQQVRTARKIFEGQYAPQVRRPIEA